MLDNAESTITDPPVELIDWIAECTAPLVTGFRSPELTVFEIVSVSCFVASSASTALELTGLLEFTTPDSTVIVSCFVASCVNTAPPITGFVDPCVTNASTDIVFIFPASAVATAPPITGFVDPAFTNESIVSVSCFKSSAS